MFLLREVFDYEHAEIAQIAGRDEAACHQLFSRGKKHISDHRPQFPTSPEDHAKMVGRFMEACIAGDLDGLMSLLAEDVTGTEVLARKETRREWKQTRGSHKLVLHFLLPCKFSAAVTVVVTR